MKLYDVKQNGGYLEVRTTVSGRLLEAGARMLTWGPIVFAAEALFFLPDYLGEYRSGPRDERIVFWLALAALAALIASIGGIVRFLRRDAWILDADREKLVFQTRPFWGRATEAEIELNRLVGVDRRDRDLPHTSSIELKLRGYPDETLVRTRWGGARLNDLETALSTFADTHSLEIEFESDSR